MGGVIANKGRIRKCAKDFWHMVGWALNCSVKYPKRWKYWKVWLDFMLDVLDDDWMERRRQDLLDPVGKDAEREQQPLLRKCLLVKYLSEAKGRSSAVKRVVRSAFADGSPDSLKEFPEVFPNETKELKVPNGRKRKREDLRKHQIGDYDDEDEEIAIDSSELTDQTPEPSQDVEDALVIDPWLGGSESIALRQRLLMLVSSICIILGPTNVSSSRALLPSSRTVSMTALRFTVRCTIASKLFPFLPSLFFFRQPAHPSYQY